MAETKSRYTVVYEGDPSGAKILSGNPAPGKAVAVMAGDLVADNLDLRLASIADGNELMRLVGLSAYAYPGPWFDGDGSVVGTETLTDAGDIICDMPSEGDCSRKNWPGNRDFIIASANFVRAQIERRRAALDLSTAVEG